MPIELKSSLRMPACVSNIPEITTPRQVELKGSPLPPWMKGTIWTVGPGMFDMEKGSFKNWIDGLTIATKYEIDPGEGSSSIRVTSKYVNSMAYKKAKKAKQPVSVGIMNPAGPDETRGFFSKFAPFTVNDVTDNANGAVLQLEPNKFYAVAESHTCYELNPKSLATVGAISLQKLFNFVYMSPQVPLDPVSGEQFICGAELKHNSKSIGIWYVIMRLPPANKNRPLSEKYEILGSIPSRWKFGCSPLRQCFTLTENYIVFLEIPLIPNLLKMAATYIKGYRMIDWMDWMPNDKTKFAVMERSSGKLVAKGVEYLSLQAFVTASIINAYEEIGADGARRIILDVTSQPNHASFEAMNINNIRSLCSCKNYIPGVIDRYIIPIIDGNPKRFPDLTSLLPCDVKATAVLHRKGEHIKVILTPETLIGSNYSKGYDLAIINPNWLGKKHNFMYTACLIMSTVTESACTNNRGVTKVALLPCGKREQLKWESDPGTHVWKPTFIPNPTSTQEDDGIVAALVSNLRRQIKDYFVFLDASTMKEIARAELKDCPVSSYPDSKFYPSDE